MTSIHGRVYRAAAFVTGAALLLAGATAYLLIRDDLNDDLNRSLTEWAQSLAKEVDDDEPSRMKFLGGTSTEKGRAFRIRDQAGRVLAQDGDQDLLATEVPPTETAANARTTLANEVRIVCLKLSPEVNKKRDAQKPISLVEITVSSDLDGLEKSLAGIGAALLIACIGASVLVAAILSRVTRSALRPVNLLSRSIAAIDPTSMPTSMCLPNAPDELQPVIIQLDALLVRLASSWERERTFSAAAAHELRTPLAGLRATLDVALARDRNAAALRSTMETCQGMVRQMEGVVSGLLLLARADAGGLAPRMEHLDLVHVLATAWMAVSSAHGDAERKIACDLPAQALVISEADLATMLVRILLDNAVAHGSAADAIRVKLARRESSGPTDATAPWVLTIANSGCILSPEDVTHAHERFWRGDRARSANERHAGLGLSIGTAVAQALGADFRIEVDGEWFVATVVVPSAPTALIPEET